MTPPKDLMTAAAMDLVAAIATTRKLEISSYKMVVYLLRET